LFGWILCYANYISIKLFYKEKKGKEGRRWGGRGREGKGKTPGFTFFFIIELTHTFPSQTLCSSNRDPRPGRS
jgi:hypothetical protein